VDQSRLNNENSAVDGGGSSSTHVDGKTVAKGSCAEDIANQPVQDPLIYPGLYSPSGFDMMGILVSFPAAWLALVYILSKRRNHIPPLAQQYQTRHKLQNTRLITPQVRVRTRPNPIINIGNVDSSVSLILCDTTLPDIPIVYCSETFEALTGYNSSEILGVNCRFLQHSPVPIKDAAAEETNKAGRKVLREAIEKGEEARALLINYRKNGERFENLLTMVPIKWVDGEVGRRYVVGFQADASACSR